MTGVQTCALPIYDSRTIQAGFVESIIETFTSNNAQAITAQFVASITENSALADLLKIHGWFRINDDQTVTWVRVVDSQSPNWTNIDNIQ